MDLEFERILGFWGSKTIDNSFGGFIGQIDNQGGKVSHSSKGAVLNARISGTFSAAYNLIGSEKLENLAARAFEYIMYNFWDVKNGGLYWEITGKDSFLESLEKVWNFIRENMIDYENGEWFGRIDKRGISYESEDKVGFWKCPYQYPCNA